MANSGLWQFQSIPTFRDLQGRFTKAEEQLLESRRDLMRDLGKRYTEIARDEAPKRTGQFADNIRFRTFIEGNSLGFRISSPQPLGKFIVLGTKPHVIAAKNVQFLRFYWEKGPEGPGVYFFRSVNHPGTKPNRFHDRAYRKWRPEAESSLKMISTRTKKFLIVGR